MKKDYVIKNEATNDFSAMGTLNVKVGPRFGRVLRDLIEENLIAGATVDMANENQMAIHFIAGDPMATSDENDNGFVNGFSGDNGFLVKVGSRIGRVLVKLGEDFLLTSASLSMINETTVSVNLNIGDIGIELIETDNVEGDD
ncbi:MAG: hypothetical protein E7392_00380 [Ruminococcaceae bacterium]|nr:hypothetical protein [Oscillospiraceae bacterium]